MASLRGMKASPGSLNCSSTAARRAGASRFRCVASFPGWVPGSGRAKPPATARGEARTVPDQDAAPGPPPEATQLQKLAKLADRLLMNAASLREPRGATYCLRCRGSGTLECKACKGDGVLPQGRVKAAPAQRLAAQVQQIVGGGSTASMSEDNWIISNRCTKCHGTGVCQCPQCGGAGQRGPAPAAAAGSGGKKGGGGGVSQQGTARR